MDSFFFFKFKFRTITTLSPLSLIGQVLGFKFEFSCVSWYKAKPGPFIAAADGGVVGYDVRNLNLHLHVKYRWWKNGARNSVDENRSWNYKDMMYGDRNTSPSKSLRRLLRSSRSLFTFTLKLDGDFCVRSVVHPQIPLVSIKVDWGDRALALLWSERQTHSFRCCLQSSCTIQPSRLSFTLKQCSVLLTFAQDERMEEASHTDVILYSRSPLIMTESYTTMCCKSVS